jgi:hypothetical protein
MKKPTKVNSFDPIEPGLTMEHYDDGTAKRKSLGIPLRLQMATQIASGMLANSEISDRDINSEDVARAALKVADMLIQKHNEDIDNLEVK